MFGSVGRNPNDSFELPQPPDDSISGLAWGDGGFSGPSLLACSSWDKSVRVWAVQTNNRKVDSEAKALFNHEAPALCCALSKTGTLLSGGCDNLVRMHNLTTQQSQPIGQHDAPVGHVFSWDESNFVVSGGWDSTIRVWDGRSSTPGITINVGAKIEAMDFKFPALAVARSDHQVAIYNFQQPSQTPVQVLPSTLRMQARCISLFHDKKGVAVGSIEGRCGVMFLEDNFKKQSFAFKCHRIEDRGGGRIFPVHCLSFNSLGTFATGGGDGTVFFWDKDHRQRLKGFDSLQTPITALEFSPRADLFAYAASYDWHKGCTFADPAKFRNRVFVNIVSEDMVKWKQPATAPVRGVRR